MDHKTVYRLSPWFISAPATLFPPCSLLCLGFHSSKTFVKNIMNLVLQSFRNNIKMGKKSLYTYMFLWKWSLIYITWKQLHIETLLLASFLLFSELWSLQTPSVTAKLHPEPAVADRRCISYEARCWKTDGTPRMASGADHDCRGRQKDNCSALEYKEKCFRPSSVSTLKHAGIFSKLSPSPNPPTTNNVISQLVLIHLDNSGWIVKGCYFLGELEEFVQQIPLW